MSKKINNKKIVGKIGYCDNSVLGIRDNNGNIMKGGHYVYIREVDKDGKANVNTITSLENKNGKYDFDKLHNAKFGHLYPIPVNDANFSRWSAINLGGNLNNIPLSKIEKIGSKHIKRRHQFFVGKFTKKIKK